MSTDDESLDMSLPWSVGELPFFFRHTEVPSNAQYGLPDRLPFLLDADRETGLIRQPFNKGIETTLDLAYRQGSILSGAMDSTGIGQRYALDFLAYIEAATPAMGGRRILEIGSGTGYLLSLLRDRGADVMGIEPGPQGDNTETRFGIKTVRGFFPSGQISGNFDVVIAYGVLEHLSDPGGLLREIKKQLAPQGIIILAVPDCEPYLQAGDLSCLIHEHWSYFTADSLEAVVRQEGFSVAIAQAGFGGVLYCSASLSEGKGKVSVRADGIPLLTSYRAKSIRMLSRLANLLSSAKKERKSIGVYVAGRLLNALSLIGNGETTSDLRFFDDNEALHGKYFPGFSAPVEDWGEFLNHPPDIVLIASNTFGHKIRARIEEAVDSRIVAWDDLYDRNL